MLEYAIIKSREAVKALALEDRQVHFSMSDMLFKYDEEKNRQNIEKHGISFMTVLLSIGSGK